MHERAGQKVSAQIAVAAAEPVQDVVPAARRPRPSSRASTRATTAPARESGVRALLAGHEQPRDDPRGIGPSRGGSGGERGCRHGGATRDQATRRAAASRAARASTPRPGCGCARRRSQPVEAAAGRGVPHRVPASLSPRNHATARDARRSHAGSPVTRRGPGAGVGDARPPRSAAGRMPGAVCSGARPPTGVDRQVAVAGLVGRASHSSSRRPSAQRCGRSSAGARRRSAPRRATAFA